jgi:hypothetical protein
MERELLVTGKLAKPGNFNASVNFLGYRMRKVGLAHARILLKADQVDGGPAWPDEHIAEALDVGLSTIARVRQRFVEQGLEAALSRKPQDRPSRQRKLDGRAEARLIDLACAAPPDGRQEWTMQLLADQLRVPPRLLRFYALSPASSSLVTTQVA